MLYLLAISVGVGLCRFLLLILPDASAWVLPDGITAAFSTMAGYVGVVGAFLPSGVAGAISDSLSYGLLVFLGCLPFYVARHFIPFIPPKKAT